MRDDSFTGKSRPYFGSVSYEESDNDDSELVNQENFTSLSFISSLPLAVPLLLLPFLFSLDSGWSNFDPWLMEVGCVGLDDLGLVRY